MTHHQPPPDSAGRADLLPCPFCGAQPVVSCEPPEASDGYYVYCDTDRCPLNLEGWSWRVTSPEEARAMWNRRSRPASPAAEPPFAYFYKRNGEEMLTFQPPDRVIAVEKYAVTPLYTHPAPPAPAGVDALLREVMEWHADPKSSDYNECDTDPCMWCEQAAAALAALKDSGGGK